MKKRLIILATATFCTLMPVASAQAFTSDVTVTKSTAGPAKFIGTNTEGSSSFVADDTGFKIEAPNGTQRVRFLNGNMMIGTASPVQKLHLFQGSTVGARFRLENTEGYTDFGSNDGKMQIIVKAAGDPSETQVATINSAGNMNLTGEMSATVVEVRGGSDLSERFDVTGEIAAIPGMVVSIDPENAGKLMVARESYDKKVAGIISGAGGLNTGMIMGQQGTQMAHGDFPVALTGRVYCYVDADIAPVRPGDLLTSSATPGHAMKVLDHAQAAGATLGKAMTGLESGKGLVLVLVNLH